ncbi:TetR/AcrR family transcriptional regulator [Alkaliphilus transvaalensis]|uniref:TetR/AcrR family transcriptional regulator n=1 Tax=Alkaliphilus transvaalensis TaxID=114628 RepID=UPI00047BBFDB|nr:TetR/AcrR family transcriptional regulator [Alkaliphilus transvaalensis]
MKATFFNLSNQKKENLINECIHEFAEYNFSSASINRILKRAQISKGGLFKYIHGKNDLYIFVITGIMEGVISHQAAHINELESCYFDRIHTLLHYGCNYYKDNPMAFRAMLNAFYDLTSPMYHEVVLRRKELIHKHQKNLLKGINWNQYNRPKEDVLKFSEYLIEGFNVLLLKKVTTGLEIEDFEKLVKQDIDILISTLKKGLERKNHA